MYSKFILEGINKYHIGWLKRYFCTIIMLNAPMCSSATFLFLESGLVSLLDRQYCKR